MTAQHATDALTAAGHARAMAGYIRDGEGRAMALGNRGPIKLDGDGNLDAAILEAYWRTGFYVLEGVINGAELAELRADVARVLAGAPVSPDADCDKGGKQAIGHDFALAPYGWARPLSDPLGGTAKNKGRHPVKMLDPAVPEGAPEWPIERLRSNLQLRDSCLHLYGHSGLLAVAEAVLGPDLVLYNEVVFIKEPGLGPSVAWHQDGTTHWDAADWDHGAHGFNFMAQLHPSTAGNGVWVLPGSHKLGKMDVRQLVADSGSERIEGAVPLLCGADDVFICNRQLVHGSFANSSLDRRITLNAGFFRGRVLDVTTSKLDDTEVTYTTEKKFHERCRIIALVVDARQQRFPEEPRYIYQPLAGQEDDNRWSEQTRKTLIRDYNLQDFYI